MSHPLHIFFSPHYHWPLQRLADACSSLCTVKQEVVGQREEAAGQRAEVAQVQMGLHQVLRQPKSWLGAGEREQVVQEQSLLGAVPM